MINALHDEIRRHKDARYDHKLHAILLVTQGFTCPEVSKMMGDSVRSIQNWVKLFDKRGFSGIVEKKRPGRPSRLTDEQMAIIKDAITRSPREFDIQANIWDGKTLSWFILNQFDIILEVRQCQRLFRKLGFTYRKPRPLIAGTDEETKNDFKKTINDTE
jgi:transposase